MSPRDRIIDVLRDEKCVRFALLFGSRARGRERPDSDWDVAAYLDEGTTPKERFAARVRLAAALEAVGEVDVVVLNDADPLLGQRALSGEVLFVRDRGAYVRYFVRTMGLAEDRRHFDRIIADGRRARLEGGTFGRS